MSSAATVARMQKLAFGCLGASVAVFLLRRKGELLVGQLRISAKPYLVVSRGDLVSVQHTFTGPGGVKLFLVPMLPVAQQDFYDDVVRDLAAENAIVLKEGVQPEVPEAQAGVVDDARPPEPSEFDREFAEANAEPQVEWRDYGETSSSGTSTSGPVAKSAPSGGRPVAHQVYFDDLVAATCPQTLADLGAGELRWTLSQVFQFTPLSEDRKARLMREIRDQAQQMQYGGSWSDDPRAAASGQFARSPDSIAVPWNAGSCAAIAEALSQEGYTLLSRTNRIILDNQAYRRLYRLRLASETTGVSMVLSKMIRM